MNCDLIRQIITVLSFLLTLTANGLANALPLNGLTTAEISNSFPVLFTPANYVFAIWGVIYLGLTVFVVYQALPSQRENPRLRRLGYWFSLGNVANAIWIFAWHYLNFPATEVFMLLLLTALIIAYRRLDIGRSTVSRAGRWLVNLPFSIYLGWISVATIANTAILLYDLGWDGFGIAAPVWTAIMLLVASPPGRADAVPPERCSLCAGTGLGLRRHRAEAVRYATGRLHGGRDGRGYRDAAARPVTQTAGQRPHTSARGGLIRCLHRWRFLRKTDLSLSTRSHI